MDSNSPEFSLVVLSYRSEEKVLDFARGARDLVAQLTDSYEVVLVGNYLENTIDKTKEYIKILEKESDVFKGVYKVKKGMMGWDMRQGLNKARGKYICVIDGDGQFPIESITRCYEAIKTDKYGLVKTYRSKRGDGLWRKLISFVYNILFGVLFPMVKANDVNSKPKLFTRDCYSQLNLTSDDWFIDAEIMIRIGQLNIPFYELPVEFNKLDGRQSFVKPGAIIEFIKNLIKYRFNKN